MRKFNTSFPGYNKGEVNSFVNSVTNEYESMLNNLKERDKLIETLKNELEHYKNIENTLNRALLVAEESSNNIKKVAYDESKVIIEEAKRNATRIINTALLKAEKIDNEANELKVQVLRYKKRYKNLLEEQLDEVEKLDLKY